MNKISRLKDFLIPIFIVFIITYFSISYYIPKQYLLNYSIVFGLFYLATNLVFWFGLNKFSKYIRSIKKITDEIAPPEDKSENIDDTVKQVGTIAEKLNYYDRKLTRNQKSFSAVIDSIGEVIWIQKTNGLIKVYNRAFSQLFDDENPKNKYFWNVVRQYNIYQFVDSIHKNPSNKLKKIQSENSSMLCSSSYIEETNEIVFILHDTTELQQLETIKKDLILNVSHELRTPLTSIKGFLETLEDELESDHAYYIQVIRRNTDRLIHIVNDLLILTKLEHTQELEYEEIELAEFFDNILLLFENKLNEKNLNLVKEIDPDLPKIQADQFKLEQVLINLIDNAIKYTDTGTIRLKAFFDKKIYIEVSDSGRGIPQEHLGRLFERFYVVDKSRSRKLGGSGLGLSIVKHIVQLHNGEVKVKSEIGNGSTFTIILPLEKK